MLIYFICSIFSKVDSHCDIQTDGTVFLEYYKEHDTDHQLMEPHLHMLDAFAHENDINLKIQKVDCNSCICPDIKNTPTFKIMKDNKVLDSFTGYSEYSDLLQFVAKNLSIYLKKKNSLVDLKERDFYSTFEEPWLVLFYKEENKNIELLLKHVREIFENTIKIGRIDEKESKNILGRYNINVFPVIMGIHSDLSVPFLEDLTINNILNFANRLVEPSLQKIQKKDLTNIISKDESFYLVLFKDEVLADNLFFKYAHSFKFKIKMYKSEDKALFDQVGIPDNDQDKVKLTIYKNGRFHIFDKDIFDDNLVVDWIFHTHFANVTKVSDSTFHSVFNGMKPVFLLITTNDKLLEEFNEFARHVHYGLPFINMLFASINLNEYMLFTQALLPKIEIPTFVVYSPHDKKFYHNKIILRSENFKIQATDTLKLYESGKMKPYIRKSFEYFTLFLWVSVILLVCVSIYAKENFFKY
jgi:thioredoxin domain-containing protein 5